MADITLSTKANVDASTAMFAGQITGRLAGEDILAGQALEIRADGKLYKRATRPFVGIAPRNASAGQPLTAYGINVRFHASDAALEPGKLYFLSATAGGIADAATAADAQGAFLAVSTNDLEIIRVGTLV